MTTHEEFESLLGAYALDAVDAPERDAVEAHLRECPRCRAEVAEHREVAALLASSAGADAPAGLWDRITVAIDGDADPDDVRAADLGVFGAGSRAGASARGASVVALDDRRRWRPATIGAAALAAVAAVAIALLGWRVVDQGDQIDRLQTAMHSGGLAQAALAAEADPRARAVDLVTTDGRALATAVVLPDGTGYLVRDQLSRLAADRTYQLWAVVGDRTISAGVLGNDPSVLAFRAPSSASALAVTDEVAGGVVQTQQTPLATGHLRTA